MNHFPVSATKICQKILWKHLGNLIFKGSGYVTVSACLVSLYVFIRGCHGDGAAHTTQGNDQINVNVANEAAPMPRCSASSALTRYHSRRLLMRRHASTFADARARGRARAPHADKSKTGLILVSRISYFHASKKKNKKQKRNCGGAPTDSAQTNPACLRPSTLACALSAKSSRLDTYA